MTTWFFKKNEITSSFTPRNKKMDMIKTNSDIKTGFFEPPNESNQSS